MIIRFFLILLLCNLFSPFSAHAGVIKDSTYFLLNDGVMTKEEMEEESQYVYEQCTYQPILKTYYNCECLAGAFLVQREKQGPLVAQEDIFQKSLTNPSIKCTNAANIAGDNYTNCMGILNTLDELGKTHEKVCSCAANKVAFNFQKRPMMEPSFIRDLLMGAMAQCKDSLSRPVSQPTTDFNRLN